MNKLFYGVIWAFLAAAPIYAAEPLVLDNVLLRAREHNPEILAAREAWYAAQHQVPAASAWPDPTFTYIDEKFPSGMDGVDPEKVKHYRIEQAVPFPGKLSLDARMKHHEARIAESAYRDKTLQILGETRMRYYQLFLTDQKIQLASQGVEVMKAALNSAQARLGSNQTSASDVFMAQTEVRKMENALFEQQQQRQLIAIELNTLLDQPTETELGTAQEAALADLPLSLADFQQLARSHAPMYLSALHEKDHSQSMLSRNRLQFAPDLGLMAERETAAAGPPGRQIGVSITFPLWVTRPWAQLKQAQAHLVETEANSLAMQNHVLNKVHSEFIQYNTHLTLARNYHSTLLPLALSNLKITRQRYAAGDADFLRLLEAFRTWITTHNDYQLELYQVGEHGSLLGQWIGIDLENAKTAMERTHAMKPEASHE